MHQAGCVRDCVLSAQLGGGEKRRRPGGPGEVTQERPVHTVCVLIVF